MKKVVRRKVTGHKMKGKGGSSRIDAARLTEMIEEATVDCYGESEQMTGWFTMLDENLATPFETVVFGVTVTVKRIDLAENEQIVAVCSRGRDRQSLPILDLPLPTPQPKGSEWIDAFRQWSTPR
jgi:hypothetical protein